MGGAFRGCKELESVTLPKNLEAIESNFFSNCKKLAFVELPKTVKDIGYNAFSATSLESITLPKSVERLDVQFLRGSNITALYYEGTETDWDEIFFYNEGVFKQDVTVYYYSEEKPPLNGDSYEGRYWRYVDGVPTVWEA